jgi:hypothetical protein
VPTVDWSKTLNLGLAVDNVRSEFPGDWYRDPWGWPELGYMLNHAPEILYDNCAASGARRVALIDVPKENWGSRPAMVLDVVDRVVYQAVVDRLSVLLIGDLSSSVFGWRLPLTGAKPGTYSHNNLQWDGYRSHLGILAAGREVALRTCWERGHVMLVGCQGRRPGAGARRRVMSPIMDHLTMASAFSGRRS